MHLEAAAARGSVQAQAELDSIPELPPLAAHVFRAWQEIGLTRGSGGFGPAPITRHDIRQWEQDEFRSLAPWERRTILRIDQAWLASVAEQSGPKK